MSAIMDCVMGMTLLSIHETKIRHTSIGPNVESVLMAIEIKPQRNEPVTINVFRFMVLLSHSKAQMGPDAAALKPPTTSSAPRDFKVIPSVASQARKEEP